MRTLTINGKAAVPLRAVPFLTGGFIDPLCITMMLEDPELFPDVPALKPFTVDEQRAVKNIHPASFWLYGALVRAGSAGPVVDAIDKLPAGILVWKDAVRNVFDAMNEKHWETETRGYKTAPRAWLEVPYIEKELENKIFEGLQALTSTIGKEAAIARRHSRSRARSNDGVNPEVQVVADQLAQKYYANHGRWPSKKILVDDIVKSMSHRRISQGTIMREFKATKRATGR